MIIAVLDKKGEDAAAAVVEVLKTSSTGRSDNYGIATPTACVVEKDADALQRQNMRSAVVAGYTFPQTLPHSETQGTKLENATLVFTGRTYPPTQTVSAADFFANQLKQNHQEAAETLLSEVEGDFAFTIAKPEAIIAGRDPIGVQPLYYGENNNIAALAVNRRALWKLGIEKPQSFPPGHVAVVNREGFKFKPVKTLAYSKPKPITMLEAAETLQNLLEDSVRKRVCGLKEVAVAFSGGLDSSVVAFLAKKCRVNVHLVHVSLKNHAETEEAQKAADELKLPLQVHLFEERDVEETAAKVVGLIEEPDAVKASIGVPFYWGAEKTAQAGFNALLAGQGADELFGGYQRYVNEYLAHGEEKVRRTMFSDVVGIHESNIERDVKICSFHNVALRLPFASYAIADFALSLPIELKIERNADSSRKLVLRKAAEKMGLSASIAEKPKKAVQYATGVSDALKKLAKRQNLTVNEYVRKLFLDSLQP